MDQVLFTLTLVATLGCGLIAGVFFAFSSFVMSALARLPPNEGLAAMQSINITVLNRLFLGVFLGTAAPCLALLVWSLLRWRGDGVSPYLMAGSALYLVGCVLVTIVANIPRNESLASLVPGDPAAESQWARYVRDWTAWNHVRAGASLAAATSFGIALGRGSFG